MRGRSCSQSESVFDQKLGYPGGLINYGNNCFANAIVQCLAASSMFIRWLDEQSRKNAVSHLLLELIQSVNGQPAQYASESTVATLIEHMRQPRWSNPFEQQDSHEFLLALLNSLVSSVQAKQMGFAACLDADESNSHMITESPLVTPHPFQGLQVTQLQCTRCIHKVDLFALLVLAPASSI